MRALKGSNTKVWSAALAALLCGLAACGGAEEPPATATETPAAEQPAPAPTPEPATAPAAEPEAAEADGPRQAPPLGFTALDGRTVSLADLRGKAVLVFFFSTDCPHCQHAADVMAPIYASWKDRGVEFLGLALNPTAQQNLGAFVAEHRVAFPVTTADRQTFVRFAGLSMMARFYYPYLIFVDPEGNIAETHQGSDQMYFGNLGQSLETTLAQLAPK